LRSGWIRRLKPAACRQALAALADRQQDAVENIHTLRKNGKRLRGGLELLGAPEPVIQELRDFGRLLSVARDSTVRVLTMRALCERAGEGVMADPEFEVAMRQLEAESKLGGAPPAAVRKFIRDRLESVVEWLQDARFSGSKGVTKRMRQLISRAERRLRVIARKPKQLERRLRVIARKPKQLEDYHETRKAVKALLGAAQFLFETPERALRREMRRLDRLGEDLGWVQDLDVLDEWLENHGLTTARLPVLHQSMQRQIREACKAARRRARKCDLSVFDKKG